MTAAADPFVANVVKMLAPLGPIQTSLRHGTTSFHIDGHQFALSYAGRLYLRVDGATAAAFKEGGGQPFRILRDGKPVIVVGFQEPPPASLKSAETLLPWAKKGIEAARRIGAPKPDKLQ